MPADCRRTVVTLQAIDVPLARQGGGRPLLFLHGGEGPQDGLALCAGLSAHFEVLAPVHPGFAGTPIPEHFDGLDDLVYLYLDLLDALTLTDVVLVGSGLGGWAAAELAVRNTSRLGRLVLIDAVGIKPGGREARDIADIFALPAAEVARLVYHDPTSAPQPSSLSEAQVTVLASDRIAHAMYTWEPYMHNPKLRHRLHRITVPTLLLWGASDGVVPVAYAEAYCALIPGAQLKVIQRAGHLPHIEQPEAVLQHIVSFAAQ